MPCVNDLGGQLNEIQMSTMVAIAACPPVEITSRTMAEDGGLGLIGVLSTRVIIC